MVAVGEQLAARLETMYTRGGGADVDFAEFLRSGSVGPGDDEALAELIDADGRMRLERGLPVELSRYLGAVPDLPERPVPLDAAIEFSLRWRSGSGAVAGEAVEWLSGIHPDLAGAIRSASILSGALWSTARFRGSRARTAIRLPADLGPVLASGRSRYELRELLGSGAHGSVYLGTDRLLSDQARPAWVAIKVLRDAGDRWEEDGDRSTEEATRARRISHPSVVRVLDRGESEDGDRYIVYEYVDGRTLRKWLDGRSGNLSDREAVRIAIRIARGVQAAHNVGVIHCDIKPDNVLVTREGEPKLADFGLAVRVDDLATGPFDTGESAAAGNLAFIAPEQFRREEGSLESPADVYALGGLLYYLLTGCFPNGQTVQEAEQYLSRRPEEAQPPGVRVRRPTTDADLEAICLRALSPRVADRYGSADAFANDLETWLARGTIAWTRPSILRRATLFGRRQPLAVAALAVLVAAVGLASGLGVWMSLRAERRLMEERVAAAKRLEEETAAWYKRREQNITTIAGVFRSSGMMAEQWLSTLTILEALSGPRLLDDKTDWAPVWSDRITRVKEIIDKAEAAGRGKDLETELWRTVLGYWMLRQGEPGDAERVLAGVRATLAVRLDADDGWLGMIDLLRACSTVKTALSAVPADTATLRAVEAAAATLHAGTSRLEGKEASAITRLSLECLADAYSPGLLDHPAERVAADRRLRDLRR